MPILRALRTFLLAALLLAWLPSVPASGDPDAWRVLRFEASGAAGEWVVVRHPLPAPGTATSFDFQMEQVLTVAAAPDASPHALLLPPTFLGQNGTGPLQVLHAEPILLTPDDLADGGDGRTFRGQARFSHGPLVEVAFAVGATAPWTLEVEVVLLDRAGPTVLPSVVARGGGMQVVASSRDLPFGGPVGTPTLEAALAAPGWSHVQVDDDALQPEQVRRLAADFPSGLRSDEVTFGLGYDLVVQGASSRSGKGGGAGTFQDAAGTLRAQLTHAEASLDVRLLLATLPGADAAFAGIEPGYRTFGPQEWLRDSV